jgi:N utilization substance protein B
VLASLFEAEFGQRTASAILERHLAELEGDPETARHARALVAATTTHRAEIDALIEVSAPQYPVVTLARMDRVLLRAGICEVLHSPATPARVAIAEWVELARVYGGDPARRLVNGVLGRVARDAARPTEEPHHGPRSIAVPDAQE